jgi:chromosome partitioning protein
MALWRRGKAEQPSDVPEDLTLMVSAELVQADASSVPEVQAPSQDLEPAPPLEEAPEEPALEAADHADHDKDEEVEESPEPVEEPLSTVPVLEEEPAEAEEPIAPSQDLELHLEEEEVVGAVPQTHSGGSKHKSKKKGPKAEKPSEGTQAEPQAPRTRVERPLPRIIAIANQKGGVGKTTTTVNLGAALAEIGYRVLVVDLDPQGNATTGLGIERRNFEHSMYDVIMHEHPLEDCIEPTNVMNLFVAPATLDLSGVEIELVPAFSRELRLKRAIDAVSDDFDFILIDCPPSLGLITINALAAAKEVMVPIQCEYYALEGLSQLRSTLKLVGSNLNEALELSTIVLTMYDNRTRLAADVAADVREHFPEEVCDTIIPRTVRISEAPSFGQPITVFDPQSRGAEAYRDLAKEVSNGAPKRAG